MALMDIEDLDAALATIATVTSPHGWVLISGWTSPSVTSAPKAIFGTVKNIGER